MAEEGGARVGTGEAAKLDGRGGGRGERVTRGGGRGEGVTRGGGRGEGVTRGGSGASVGPEREGSTPSLARDGRGSTRVQRSFPASQPTVPASRDTLAGTTASGGRDTLSGNTASHSRATPAGTAASGSRATPAGNAAAVFGRPVSFADLTTSKEVGHLIVTTREWVCVH